MRQTEAQRRGVEDVVDGVEERLAPSCADDRRLRHVDVLGPKTAVAVERRAVLAHPQPIHLASRRSFCSLPHGTLDQSFILTAFRLLCSTEVVMAAAAAAAARIKSSCGASCALSPHAMCPRYNGYRPEFVSEIINFATWRGAGRDGVCYFISVLIINICTDCSTSRPR